MANLGLLSDDKKPGMSFRRLSTKAFREGLAEVIEFSERTKEPLILTRHGRDRAALVSIEDFFIIEALNKVRGRRALVSCNNVQMVLSTLKEILDKHFEKKAEEVGTSKFPARSSMTRRSNPSSPLDAVGSSNGASSAQPQA